MSDSHVGRPRQKSNGNRPQYSYFTMISMAIEHQEDQKATIQDIYKFIRDSFPYYRDFSLKAITYSQTCEIGGHTDNLRVNRTDDCKMDLSI